MSDPNPTITEQDVRKVARLSRLELTDTQIADFTHQLSGVLGYVAKLDQLDLDNVEPLAHPTDLTNALRPDEPDPDRPPLTSEQALTNSPASDPPFFKVPKVIGDGGGA